MRPVPQTAIMCAMLKPANPAAAASAMSAAAPGPGAAFFCATLVAAALFGGPGCKGPDADVSRPLAGKRGYIQASNRAGATSRPTFRIVSSSDRTRELPLGALRKGVVRLHLAMDPPGAGFGVAEVRLQGKGVLARLLGDKPSVCRQNWTAEGEVGWRECTLEVARDYPNAEVSVRFEGSEDAELLMSAPVHVKETPSERPSVFVIVIGGARRDAFLTYNPAMPVGDSLDRLARDGVVLQNLRGSSSWTRTSVASLLTGTRPSTHGVLDRLDVLDPALPSLQSSLQRAGYLTGAWSATPNVLPDWGFGEGFDEFLDAGIHEWAEEKSDSSEIFALVKSAVARNRTAASRKSESSDFENEAAASGEAIPAFYYIHLADGYAPYAPPLVDLRFVSASEALVESFPVRVSSMEVAEVWFKYQRYIAELRDTDRQLGRFFDYLRTQGLYDNSIIFVTSDHGEEFLDHAAIGHGQGLYDSVLRVPGVLKLPGNRFAGSEIADEVSMADVAPTIQRLLGLNIAPVVEGRDFLDFNSSAVAQTAQLDLDGKRLAAISHGGWKLVVDYAAGSQQLFDLAADPGESNDLAEQNKDQASRLRALLETENAQRAPGWHLRVCGCAEAASLRVRIRTTSALINGVMLEADDQLLNHGGNSGFELISELTPVIADEDFGSHRVALTEPDQDELLIAAMSADPVGDTAVAISAAEGEALHYAFANGAVAGHKGWLTLTAAISEAELAPGNLVQCPAYHDASQPPACLPHLRIWSVARAPRLPAAVVEASVAERLESSEYDW